MLEVEPSGQRGLTTTGSSRKSRDLEKFTSSIPRTYRATAIIKHE